MNWTIRARAAIITVKVALIVLALAIFMAAAYMMRLCFMGQVASDSFYREHGYYPGESGWREGYTGEEGEPSALYDPTSAYESCQSPRQQAYMREHQRRIDAERISNRQSHPVEED